jgi:hypothetical protein
MPIAPKKDKRNEVAGLGFSIKPEGRVFFLAIVEWALANSITALTVQSPPTLALVISALRADPELLADPSLAAERMLFVPMLMRIRNSTPQTMRRLFRFGNGTEKISADAAVKKDDAVLANGTNRARL